MLDEIANVLAVCSMTKGVPLLKKILQYMIESSTINTRPPSIIWDGGKGTGSSSQRRRRHRLATDPPERRLKELLVSGQQMPLATWAEESRADQPKTHSSDHSPRTSQG
jgi:hypothetical protein